MIALQKELALHQYVKIPEVLHLQGAPLVMSHTIASSTLNQRLPVNSKTL